MCSQDMFISRNRNCIAESLNYFLLHGSVCTYVKLAAVLFFYLQFLWLNNKTCLSWNVQCIILENKNTSYWSWRYSLCFCLWAAVEREKGGSYCTRVANSTLKEACFFNQFRNVSYSLFFIHVTQRLHWSIKVVGRICTQQLSTTAILKTFKKNTN